VRRVLEVGTTIPDATVWAAPNRPARLRDLVAERPKLLLFYLFDWSST
jgi:peroxiredoxin